MHTGEIHSSDEEEGEAAEEGHFVDPTEQRYGDSCILVCLMILPSLSPASPLPLSSLSPFLPPSPSFPLDSGVWIAMHGTSGNGYIDYLYSNMMLQQ